MEWLLANLPFVYTVAGTIVVGIVTVTAVAVTVKLQLAALTTSIKGLTGRVSEVADKLAVEVKELREHYNAEIAALREHHENELKEMRADFGQQISAASGLANMARAELASYQVEAANLYARQSYLTAMEARLMEHFDSSINRLLQMVSLLIAGKAPPANDE